MNHALSIEREFNEKKWKENLSDLQYAVTREGATERAFSGIYDKHFEKEFTTAYVVELSYSIQRVNTTVAVVGQHFIRNQKEQTSQRIEDLSHGMRRIEVKCSNCDSHLGMFSRMVLGNTAVKDTASTQHHLISWRIDLW